MSFDLLPRYIPAPTPTLTQLAEQALVANTIELHQAAAELTLADETAKQGIRNLLNAREHARVKFMNLQATNASLKQSLGRCK